MHLCQYAGHLCCRRDLQREGLWGRGLRLVRAIDWMIPLPAGTEGSCAFASGIGMSGMFECESEISFRVIDERGQERVVMDSLLRLRIVRHFDRLHLAQLYASKAAEELSQIVAFLDRLRERADDEAVRLYLEDQVRSRRALFKNTWQAALYEATAQSVWFCKGRYRLT